MSYVGEYRPQTDLVVGYHLADLYDFSGSDCTLTNTGSVTFASAKFGKGAILGAANSSKCLYTTASTIDLDLSAGAQTLAVWVKVGAAPGNNVTASAIHWETYSTTKRYMKITYKNDGGTLKLQGDFSGNVASYTTTLTVDTWYWVVFTAGTGAGAATSLYLNGVLVASSTKGTTDGGTSDAFIIGCDVTGAQWWLGDLDEVAAYKKAFTATEILAWYDYQVGTVHTEPYVAFDGSDLSAYVDNDIGVTTDGGDLKINDYVTPSRDFAGLSYGGRERRTYSFNLMSMDRATLETFMGTINNAEELAEFYPFNEDRMTYAYSASARFMPPFRCWDGTLAANRWYFGIDCSINALDTLLHGRRQTVFSGYNHVIPTETISITNAGTFKSGLDYLSMSGYFNGSLYTTGVTLTINEKTITLCDKLLHGDTFEVNRYGQIKQSYYTDFNVTYANLKNYLESNTATGAATAGYHLSGKSPLTNIATDGDQDDGFFIQADTETVATKVNLTGRATDTTGAAIAADMQACIRALGGAYAAVTCEFTTEGRYKITSGTTGATSKIRITDSEADYADTVTHHLKLGTAQYSWWPGDKSCGQYGEGEDHDGTATSSTTVDYGSATAGYHTSGEVPCTVITGAGYHVSGANPATVLSKTGTKLKIQCDAHADAHEITLSLAACTSGPNTAAELQTKIRAIHADFDGIVCRYENGRYLIISESTASTSNIRITSGATSNVANSLKLGTAWGGTNYDGSATTRNKFAIQADSEASPSTVTLTLTGHNTGTLIAEEMQTQIRALGGAYDNITVVYNNGRYIITSETTGANSKIRITSDASNDIAARLKIGTANGGTNTDGVAGASIAQNAFAMGKGGMLLFPMYGPIPISTAPYIEFTASSVTGTPKAVYCTSLDTSQMVYLADEIEDGYNKIYFPDLQAEDDVWIGVYTDADSSMILYDMYVEVRRDVSPSEFSTSDPGDAITFAVGADSTGSCKLANLELYYRDGYWS